MSVTLTVSDGIAYFDKIMPIGPTAFIEYGQSDCFFNMTAFVIRTYPIFNCVPVCRTFMPFRTMVLRLYELDFFTGRQSFFAVIEYFSRNGHVGDAFHISRILIQFNYVK